MKSNTQQDAHYGTTKLLGRELSLSFRSLLMFFLVCFSGFSTAVAQTDPTDCTSGCTSKDIKIIRAFLSDAAGNELPSTFICSGTASVYLTLELTTKSPRIGTAIYGNIRNYNPITEEIGGIIATAAQCFGGVTLNATTDVTFTSPFTWTCGAGIILTDVYISWGTGNTDFCTSGAFQCGATPSKCNNQLGNIVISTPTIETTSASACSLVAFPNYSAYFDLTSLESDIKNGGNLDLTWHSASPPDGTNLISAAAEVNYQVTVASKDVYAKVCPAGSTTGCVTVTVPLTVNPKPAEPTICVVDVSLCGPTTGSVTILAPLDDVGVDYEYSINNGTTWGDGTTFSPLSAGSVTGVKVRYKGTQCASDAADCGDSDCNGSKVANINDVITPIKTTEINKTDNVSFEVYPVPFKDLLTIKYKFDYKTDVKIEIFDLYGNLLLSKTDTNSYLDKETTLDLNLKIGKEQIYIVKIATNRGSSLKKVISSK